MATIRVIIAEALRLFRAIAPGEDPTADDLVIALESAQALVLDIHEGRGPLITVDLSDATYVPTENVRVRVQSGDTAAVTLPNSVPIYARSSQYDYGFVGTTLNSTPPVGSTSAADGVTYRQPTDGSRIEIVGTTTGLYFYRADINTWMPAYSLTLDTESPFNDRLKSHFAALLAERLADVLGAPQQISPLVMARFRRGRMAMFSQTGRERPALVVEYF